MSFHGCAFFACPSDRTHYFSHSLSNCNANVVSSQHLPKLVPHPLIFSKVKQARFHGQVCHDAIASANTINSLQLALWSPVIVLAFLQARTVLQRRDAEELNASETQGEIAYKPQSYTLWPIAESVEGCRFRIPVGDVKNCAPQTFFFDKVLPRASELVCVTMPRPLGLILEEDTDDRQIVVCNFVEGTVAEQRMKLAQFDKSRRKDAVLVGDIVRAFTCTTVVYPTQTGLRFGLKLPQRHKVVYGADDQPWLKVTAALKTGLVEDGPVSMVVERQITRS